MSRYVSKRELSELLNVSERTLTAWQGQGLPIADKGGRGAAHRYDVADVVTWLVARGSTVRESLDLNEQRARLAAAQAARQELALARELRQVVRVDHATRHWHGHLIAVREALRRLGYRCAAVAGRDEAARIAIKTLVDGEVHRLLTDLANTPALPPDTGPDSAEETDDGEETLAG